MVIRVASVARWMLLVKREKEREMIHIDRTADRQTNTKKKTDRQTNTHKKGQIDRLETMKGEDI